MTVRRRLALAAKRAMDVVGAAVALVLLSPVLLWIAVACAIVQGRPILFESERSGQHGRPFVLRKFRSMRSPRRGEVMYLTDDRRVSRLGRFLRSTSLDELPELWHVLRGEMSLVGPRPLPVEYLDAYTPAERRRLDMPAGFTGWAAVNGRHTRKFEDRLALDVWYVDNWSLLLDVRILFSTLGQVLRRSDVSATTPDLDEIEFPERFRRALDASIARTEAAGPHVAGTSAGGAGRA